MTTMTTENSDAKRSHRDVVIEVKAQVMTRDDSSGGWVPVSGGGLSAVALLRDLVLDSTVKNKTSSERDVNVVYFIEGRRITDDALVLKCTLKLDLQYVAANPTFHHWRTGNKRYGLTFQNSSDARAFERSVQKAAVEIIPGRHKHCTGVHTRLQRQGTTGSDDIFMMLHFAGDKPETSTSSADSEMASSESSPLREGNRSSRDHTLSTLTYCSCQCADCRVTDDYRTPRRPRPAASTNVMPDICCQYNTTSSSHPIHDPDSDAVVETLENEYNCKIQQLEESMKGCGPFDDDVRSLDSSYVRFAKTDTGIVDAEPSSAVHEYCYPTLDTLGIKRDAAADQYHRNGATALARVTAPLPSKPSTWQPSGAVGDSVRLSTFGHEPQHHCRQICMHCGEWFDVDAKRQRCPDARDKMADCINITTCACVANAISYHCLSDEEGDFEPVCSCTPGESCSAARWTVYVLLSLVLPCLCCYLPLVGCRRCAARCGCCVTYHEPMHK